MQLPETAPETQEVSKDAAPVLTFSSIMAFLDLGSASRQNQKFAQTPHSSHISHQVAPPDALETQLLLGTSVEDGYLDPQMAFTSKPKTSLKLSKIQPQSPPTLLHKMPVQIASTSTEDPIHLPPAPALLQRKIRETDTGGVHMSAKELENVHVESMADIEKQISETSSTTSSTISTVPRISQLSHDANFRGSKGSFKDLNASSLHSTKHLPPDPDMLALPSVNSTAPMANIVIGSDWDDWPAIVPVEEVDSRTGSSGSGSLLNRGSMLNKFQPGPGRLQAFDDGVCSYFCTSHP